MRALVIFLSLSSISWCENSLTRQERKEGFESLFDGKTLARWHSIKQSKDAGAWRVRKSMMTWEKGGSWLATDDTYYDFVLRLEYRTGPGSNSGIFLRAGRTGNPAFSGMELQIRSDAGKPPDAHSTGSLYGAVAPAKNMAKPDGEWNRVEITVIRRQVAAIWNGEKILDVQLDDPKYQNAQERPLAQRLPFGHVGLQAYSSGTPVEFRNIRVKVIKTGPNFSQDK
jgi:Domain of Unknown Function (DUF1080)